MKKSLARDFVIPSHELITIKEGMAILGISSTSIYEKCYQSLFSFYIIGHRIYLIKSEIEKAKGKLPTFKPRKEGFYPSAAKVVERPNAVETPVLNISKRFSYQISIA